MANMLRAAVVGGSTLLGRELLSEIGSSAAAIWDLRILEEGEESEGQLTAAGEEALVVHSLDKDSFSGLDVVFFAATPEITAQYVDAAMQAGSAVIDLSGLTADRAGFVMRSSWVNGSQRPDLTTMGVCVPHPAALMLAIVGERLGRRSGSVDIAATVLEPASQAGSAGVDELHQQTVGLLSFQDLPKAIFDAQVAFNVQGALGPETRVDLPATLARIRRDTGRLLGTDAKARVHLQLLQAPVFHGYVISAHTRSAGGITADGVQAALQGTPVVTTGELDPSNKTATESGDLLIGIDCEDSGGEDGKGESCWLLMAGDNLGLMARSAVNAALELATLRPAPRVQ